MTKEIKLNTISTIQQPIQFTTTQINSTNAPTTASSTRAAMRRMRTETTTFSFPQTIDSATSAPTGSVGALQKEPWEFLDSFTQALMKKNYAEILAMLSKLDTQCDRLIERVEFALENVLKGQLAVVRSYFTGMMKNPEAIDLCNAGVEQLKQGLLEVMALINESGISPSDGSSLERFDSIHQFYRGFLKLSVGQSEEAIRDIRTSLTTFNFQKDWEEFPYAIDIDAIFLIKIMEQKLNTPLFPTSQTIDTTDPLSLFVAGQYNEALALLETSTDLSYDELSLKAYCLGMLGRMDEAYLGLEDRPTYLLMLFLAGDYTKVETPNLSWNCCPVLWMVPLAIKGLEH